MHEFFCNFHIILSLFSTLNLVILVQLLSNHIYTAYLMNATPLTILPDLFETLHVVLSRSEYVHMIRM